jgi:hypothetical protein
MFGSQPPPPPPPHGWTRPSADPGPSGSATAAYSGQPAYAQQANEQQQQQQQLWGQPPVPPFQAHQQEQQQQQRYDLYTAPPLTDQHYQHAPSSSAGTYWQAPPPPQPPQEYAYMSSSAYPATAPLAYAYPPAQLQHPSGYTTTYDAPGLHFAPPQSNAIASSSRPKQTIEQQLADEHRERHGEIAAQHDAELWAFRQRQAQWNHQSATGGHGILFGSTAGPEAAGGLSSSSSSLPIDQFQPEPPFHAVWGGLSQSVYQPVPPPLLLQRGGPSWAHQLSPLEPSYPTPSSAPDVPPSSTDQLSDLNQRRAYPVPPHLVPPYPAAHPQSPSAAFDYGRSTSSTDSLSPHPLPTFHLEPPSSHGLPPTAPSTGDSSRAPPLLQVTAPAGPSRSRSPRHGKAARTQPSPSPPCDTPPKSPPPAAAPATSTKSSTATRPAASGSGGTVLARRKRSLCPNLPVARCSDCNAAVAHLLLRGEDEDFAVEWEGSWLCHACMGIRREKGLGGVAKEATGSLRKRKRSVSPLPRALSPRHRPVLTWAPPACQQ